MSVSARDGDSGTHVAGADVDATAPAAVDRERSANESGHDDSGDLSGREEAAFALAQVLDPDAFRSRSLPIREAAEVLHRREVAMSVSLAAIDAGYRLVSEDDTTVERVAEALWLSDIRELPGIPDGDWATDAPTGAKEHFRAQARAAVRALREGAVSDD